MQHRGWRPCQRARDCRKKRQRVRQPAPKSNTACSIGRRNSSIGPAACCQTRHSSPADGPRERRQSLVRRRSCGALAPRMHHETDVDSGAPCLPGCSQTPPKVPHAYVRGSSAVTVTVTVIALAAAAIPRRPRPPAAGSFSGGTRLARRRGCDAPKDRNEATDKPPRALPARRPANERVAEAARVGYGLIEAAGVGVRPKGASQPRQGFAMAGRLRRVFRPKPQLSGLAFAGRSWPTAAPVTAVLFSIFSHRANR